MARRSITFLVHVTADEDEMRLREDDDDAAWTAIVGTLTTALETIALDNLDDALAPEVRVTAGQTLTEYVLPSTRLDTEGTD